MFCLSCFKFLHSAPYVFTKTSSSKPPIHTDHLCTLFQHNGSLLAQILDLDIWFIYDLYICMIYICWFKNHFNFCLWPHHTLTRSCMCAHTHTQTHTTLSFYHSTSELFLCNASRERCRNHYLVFAIQF